MSATSAKRGPGLAPAVEIAVIFRTASWRARPPGAANLCRRAARAAVAGALGDARGTWKARLRKVGCELSIVLASDPFVARLNRDYRGKSGPTNVLSFPSGLLDQSSKHGPGAHGPVALGDVVIAYGTVAAEAKAAKRPLAHHLAHLVVHGVLHLLGYDHLEERQAQRMESLEVAILRAIAVPDPYLDAGSARVA